LLTFKDLKNSCIKKTKDFIKNKQWNELDKILNESPQQLMELSDIFEAQIKNNNSYIESYLESTNDERQRIAFPIRIMLQLIEIKPNIFDDAIYNKIIDELFLKTSNYADDEAKTLSRSLGKQIITRKGDDVLNYSRLTLQLVNHHPVDMIPFANKIIEKGEKDYYGIIYAYILKYLHLQLFHSKYHILKLLE